MQWGWNPDTVEAVTTALAAVAAVAAGIFAWGAYRAERDARELAKRSHELTESAHESGRQRDLRELEEKKRAQAELVSAWAVTGEEEQPWAGVRIQNLSSAPVYSVSLGLVLKGEQSVYGGWVRVLPPTGSEPMQESIKDAALDAWRRWAGARRPLPVPLVEFTFHDAAGRWWLRDGDGVLCEISEDERWRYGRKEG